MSDFVEMRLELLGQLQHAQQSWEEWAEYANSLTHRIDEIQNSQEALQTSRDLLQSCEETSRQLEEAQQTLRAAEAYWQKLICEAAQLKQVRTEMKNLKWEIHTQACETYQIWKTMELNCNKQVEKAHLASQVWEVLQVQLECQLFEQNKVTWKDVMTELEAREKTCQAAKTLKTVYNHMEQLQDQYLEHEDEHNQRIGAVWNALHYASERTRQAYDKLVDLWDQL
jgi:hypothetical protein